jgi:hypothetical protein
MVLSLSLGVSADALTTADALTVLRAAAGLIELTAEQAAKFGISGAPSTSDALRILRVAAGLPAEAPQQPTPQPSTGSNHIRLPYGNNVCIRTDGNVIVQLLNLSELSVQFIVVGIFSPGSNTPLQYRRFTPDIFDDFLYEEIKFIMPAEGNYELRLYDQTGLPRDGVISNGNVISSVTFTVGLFGGGASVGGA